MPEDEEVSAPAPDRRRSRRLPVFLAVVPVIALSVFVASLAVASGGDSQTLISETSSIVVEAPESSTSGFDEPAHSEGKLPGECDEDDVEY